MPWDDAIRQVLKEANGVLRYTQIADRIVAQGLRRSPGATPASTVAVVLGNSLKDPDTPYVRVGRGEYALKLIDRPSATAKMSEEARSLDEAPETGALRAFGMFWQRNLVVWTGNPRLLGSQGSGATSVNFANQIGVYLLHDRERVIYVGRATDTLFARLKAHTIDRMGGRWDRFSWFGIRTVEEGGELSDRAVPWSQDIVIETMEALLIESLEPPQNRRRGDNFSAAEYSQTSDPQIEAGRKKALLDELSKSLS